MLNTCNIAITNSFSEIVVVDVHSEWNYGVACLNCLPALRPLSYLMFSDLPQLFTVSASFFS